MSSLRTVEWYWNGELYDEATTRQIEDAWQRGATSVRLSMGYFALRRNRGIYSVEFDRETNNHTQIKTTSGQRHRVSRRARELDTTDSKEASVDDQLDSLSKDFNSLHLHIKSDTVADNPLELTSLEKGTQLEVCIEGRWIAGKIIQSDRVQAKHSPHESHTKSIPTQQGPQYRQKNWRLRVFTVQYQDSDGYLATVQLHGFDDKSYYRMIGADTMSLKHNKFDIKNSKPTQYYVNKPCYKCSGTGVYFCNKCDNGVRVKKMSQKHLPCNGRGCGACQWSGKYPTRDQLCRKCNGTGKIPCHLANNRSNTCFRGLHLPAVGVAEKKYNFKPKYAIGARGKNVLRLYQVTDKESAQKIIDSGVMVRSDGRDFGSGIYFFENAEIAAERTRNEGFLVVADVFVGKTKMLDVPDVNMTADRLRNEGFDSVQGNWHGKVKERIEHVVYDWNQVWVYLVLPLDQIDLKQLNNHIYT